MFLEPRFSGQRSGWIEVICGSMFSGKTEELIRRLKRANIANQKVMVFKPERDDRYGRTSVVSHDENSLEAVVVTESHEILSRAGDCNVVGIDEAQFFDADLPEICEKLALRGKRVIAAGLDLDFRGIPFGPIPELLARAEYITKLHAICQHCGNLSTHSYRLTADEEQVVVGEKDKYEPRCRICFNMGNMLDLKIRE